MNHSLLSRRSLLKGAVALSAAAILADYPGVRLIRAQGSAEYDLIDFGPFETEVTEGPALGFGTVRRINEEGVTCGSVGVSAERFSPATWSASGKLKRLKSGKLGGQAMDISDDGVVVGHEFESVGELENRRPVVWRDGEPVELPDLDGDTAGARGSAISINNSGVISGDMRVGNFTRAVLWIDDVAQPLPDAPEGSASGVRGLNDNGTVLTSVSTGESGLVQTFGLWRDDEAVIIEFPEEVTDELMVSPQALNQQDVALFTVYSFAEGSTDWFFFTTDGDATTVVDGRADGYGSVAAGFNDDGVVVGSTFEETWTEVTAAIWRDGEHTDLNTLIASDSGLTLTHANTINNAGMIAGSAQDEDGISHGYLLIPTS